MAEAEFNEQQAQRELEREQDIFEQGAGTTEEVERAETRLRAARAIRLERAAAVSSAKSVVLEAEEAVRNMYIYAPFDGTVVTKDAEKGESIMPGGLGASSGRGSVITLAKLDELEVDTDVKERYFGPGDGRFSDGQIRQLRRELKRGRLRDERIGPPLRLFKGDPPLAPLPSHPPSIG